MKSLESTIYKELKNMGKHMRPLHCSDRKRKKFYVKEKDVWEKDTDHELIKKNIYIYISFFVKF